LNLIFKIRIKKMNKADEEASELPSFLLNLKKKMDEKKESIMLGEI
jgi:hypothetical protein